MQLHNAMILAKHLPEAQKIIQKPGIRMTIGHADFLMHQIDVFFVNLLSFALLTFQKQRIMVTKGISDFDRS